MTRHAPTQIILPESQIFSNLPSFKQSINPFFLLPHWAESILNKVGTGLNQPVSSIEHQVSSIFSEFPIPNQISTILLFFMYFMLKFF